MPLFNVQGWLPVLKFRKLNSWYGSLAQNGWHGINNILFRKSGQKSPNFKQKSSFFNSDLHNQNMAISSL